MDLSTTGYIVITAILAALLVALIRNVARARRRNLDAAYTNLALAMKHRDLEAKAANAGDTVGEAYHARLADEHDLTSDRYFHRARPHTLDDERLYRHVDALGD